MSQRYIIVRALALHFTDILCDREKNWKEVHSYFPIWLALIQEWKELTAKEF